MKKLLIYSAALFAACASLVSCNKEITENEVASTTHSVSFIAEELDTKTSMTIDGNVATFAWEDADKSHMYVYEDDTKSEDVKAKLNGTKLEVKALFDGDAPASPTYYAHLNSDITVQVPSENCYDGAADVLVAEPLTAADRGGNDNLPLLFSRKVAVNKMTVKGLKPGAAIEEVTITADKDIAGVFEKDTWTTKTTTLSILSEEIVAGEDGNAVVYFTCLPVENANLTIDVTTDCGNYTKEFAKPITFTEGAVKAFGVTVEENVTLLPNGTTLWAETWGCKTPASADESTSTVASYDYSGTTVYGEGAVTYSIGTNESTMIYSAFETLKNNIVLDSPDELLLAKKTNNIDGKLNVSGIPCENCKAATLTFRTNNATKTRYSISSPTKGVSVGEVSISGNSAPYIVTCILAFNNVSNFDLTFSNSTSSNVRIDDIELVSGSKPVLSAQYQNITFNVGTSTRSFTYSLINPVGNNDVTISAGADWLRAQIVDDSHFSIEVDPAIRSERTSTVTLSAEGAEDLILTVKQQSAEIDNPAVDVSLNDDGGFNVSWSSVSNATGYSCFYSQSQNATSGTPINAVENESVWTASVTNLSDGTYYVYVKSNATAPYFSPEEYICKSITVSTNTSDVNLTYDFTSTSIYPEGFPVGSANASKGQITSQEFSIDGYAIVVNCNNNQYMYQYESNNVRYLMFGKCNSSSADVYIELPVVSTKKLTKVEFYGNSGASTNVYLSVVEGDSVIGASKQYIANANSPVSWTFSNTKATSSYKIVFKGNNATNFRNVQCTKVILEYK